MNEILTLIDGYSIYILLGLSIFVIFLFILLIMTWVRYGKIKKRYESFMSNENVDVEDLLIDYAKRVNQVKNTQVEMQKEIDILTKRMQYCTQKLGVVRYNAYEKTGADLSFAIAFLDEQDTGVVINGIYSRDGSYTYAKPITNGISKYNLSEEELQAIEKAKTYNQSLV